MGRLEHYVKQLTHQVEDLTTKCDILEIGGHTTESSIWENESNPDSGVSSTQRMKSLKKHYPKQSTYMSLAEEIQIIEDRSLEFSVISIEEPPKRITGLFLKIMTNHFEPMFGVLPGKIRVF